MCLSQINQFFSEVSGFVRSCCDQYPGHEMHEEGCIALEDQVAQSCLLEKGTKLRVIIGNPPSNYHEDLFSQFKAECKNQMLLVSGNLRVSFQGVESLWGDCRFIPADWGS